ncbi:MAG: DUF4956 domain-containing protein [Planctomycetota bacterium]
MDEWLGEISAPQLPDDVPVLATRLLLSWVFGYAVAWIARRHKPDNGSDTLTLTLVLMSILIAMATQIIGDNIARAFSLVGALSIVRFRAAVPATRDVAFVLAAVVVGMAVGAGQYWVASIGVVIVGLATMINSPCKKQTGQGFEISAKPKRDWKLTIQTGLNADGNWEAELRRLAGEIQLVSAETTRRGSAMQMVYRVVLKSDVNATEIVSTLNSLSAVESVTIKA